VTPPAAATVAGRRHASGAAPTRKGAAPKRPAQRVAERPARAPRAASAPRIARRVSGPVARPLAGRVSAVAATAAAALPQVAPRPQAPSRRRPVAVPRPARRELPTGARLLGWLRSLPEHRLLDRLIGGRVWIVLLGTLLAGIVTLQLSLLKLNAGIGHGVQQAAALQQSNAALRAEVSDLGDPARIVTVAQQSGFVTPPQGSPRFVDASAADADRALVTMRQPAPAPPTPTVAPAAGAGADALPAAPQTGPAGTVTSTSTATGAVPSTTVGSTAAPAVPTTAGAATGAAGATAPPGPTSAAPVPATTPGGATSPGNGQ
jgi:hypothetical protein